MDCGCAGDAKKMLILNREHKCQKQEQSNCLPLSVMIAFGRPKWQMMFFHTKCSILAAVIVAKASALTHFVKLFTATTANSLALRHGADEVQSPLRERPKADYWGEWFGGQLRD
ncbi:unnamed protein product [Prunus armeniaca]